MSDRDRNRDRSRDRISRSRARRRDEVRRTRGRARTRTPEREEFLNRLDTTLNSILTRINVLENAGVNNPIAHNSTAINNDPISENCSSSSRSIVISRPEVRQSKSDTVLHNSTTDVNNVDYSEVVASAVVRNENNSEPNDTIARATPVIPSTSSTSTQELVDAIKSLRSTRTDYYVSNFDPSTHDIESWCQEVERAKLTNNWNDYECLSRVAGCLKGDARNWLNEWTSNDRTWCNFVQEFKSLCPRRLDYANILYDVMNTNSDKYTTYAEYARRTLMRLRIVKGLSEELIILIIIRGITDPQVRAAAANANLTPENLVSFMSLYVKPSRNKPDMRMPNTRKRPITGESSSLSQVKCYVCGQLGHKSFRCSKKAKLDTTTANSDPGTSKDAKGASNLKICSFCKKPGHSEQTCFAKDRSEPRNKRKVNLCTEMPSTLKKHSDLTTAVIQGIPVDVLIDSGALNISLISSDILKHFSCQLKPFSCTLKGLGSQEIVADSCVTLTVEFNEISIEADFVVVPASFMNTPIIVGTDILNRDGVTYVRTKDAQYITHCKERPKTVSTVVSDQVSINTPLQGTEREALLSALDEYSEFLITGTAATTVKTGKMCISLTDDTPVAYRPYKLSHQEKLKVRDIVTDLKDKGIIRDSQSQYSSPIILVKKKDGTDRMCVDYRALNRITVRDRYPMPLIDDHIDRLGKFNYFSSLDMATGFYQIPIEEESIHKTGFVTPEGHYEFVKMPFGLTNSPIVYQRIINETLRSFIEAGTVLVYVDDVLLLSSTLAQIN
uniref:CCHC-type domain-containing protein n=1 Tax=Pectinophora gossypiella TaxID=13191 RepID=A0A1E1WCE6_PECGO